MDVEDDGPGLHPTSPHSCIIATRTYDMERECPGRNGMHTLIIIIISNSMHGSQDTGESMRNQQMLWLAYIAYRQ